MPELPAVWTWRRLSDAAPAAGVASLRVRWGTLGIEAFAARIEKSAAPPPGYTPNTVVTEWLTVNCRGPWASRSSATIVEVRFAERADFERAVQRFGHKRSRKSRT